MAEFDYSKRRMTPEEKIDWEIRQEDAGKLHEFESVYSEIYPGWVAMLNGAIVLESASYEDFVNGFDNFTMDARRRMVVRNYGISDNNPETLVLLSNTHETEMTKDSTYTLVA